MEYFYLIAVVAVALVAWLLLRKRPQPPTSAESPAVARSSGASHAGERQQVSPVEAGESEAPPGAEPPASADAGDDSEAATAPSPAGEPGPAPESRRSLAHTSDVVGLREGLARSRGEGGFFGRLKILLSGQKEISPEIATEIEEILIASDVGVTTSTSILERLRDGLDRGELSDESRVWDALREQARRVLEQGGTGGAFPLVARPTVVLLVGVNGSGKTTTIGKLATRLKAEGRTCVLAAADTFRAAAVQQLKIWGERVGVEVVHGKDGADPGSVVFDAVKRAQEVGAEVVLADTAGRLHTKSNLMAELQKVARTAAKALEGAPHEVLLVLDATNGQNALAQAKEFTEALPLTGLVLTKLDGTAKGGMVLGICDALKLPVRFIGLGERAENLKDFAADEFVEALLGKEQGEPS